MPNGLTYYIRANKKPENRAQFHLVVNAGSILETEKQQGLAHFLEHMAFNGTKNFEKNEIINFLERTGMQFGADLNAYTSFDETAYRLEVPMDKPDVVKKAFQVLEDWAHNIKFDAKEIEKERGVVTEEWRTGRGAGGRLRDKQIPVLFHQSLYAERLPIGKTNCIATVTREDFLDYYTKWYRPDLMAVVAVGDFDAKKIEALIVEHFGRLKNPPNAPKRPRPKCRIMKARCFPSKRIRSFLRRAFKSRASIRSSPDGSGVGLPARPGGRTLLVDAESAHERARAGGESAVSVRGRRQIAHGAGEGHGVDARGREGRFVAPKD